MPHKQKVTVTRNTDLHKYVTKLLASRNTFLAYCSHIYIEVVLVSHFLFFTQIGGPFLSHNFLFFTRFSRGFLNSVPVPSLKTPPSGRFGDSQVPGV